MTHPAGRESRDVAIPRLVDQEGARLLAFARRYCGDGSEAEDLVQETFVQAFRAWDQLQDPSAARSWLYAIARRACQRMHRRRSGEPKDLETLEELMPRPASTVPDLAGDGGPHAARLRSEARELVERALAELPEAFRLPLVLSDIAELTVAEIAQVLGLKEATVKTRLHRARLKLRAVLATGLPQREAAPPPHDRSVCLDLLRAKLEAMDRRAPFPYSSQALCERCRTLLGTLDLAGEACASLSGPELPPALRARVRAATAG
ncbi:MAG: sigma-70 family RNA polymerase sigma factor [Holophagales bacterium]|nr:sigma-70 family RNA polymerase sigma factor [Holophagales bacterium]